MDLHVTIPADRIAACRREKGVGRLAILGPALRPDVGPDSDIHVLVEFGPDRVPGLSGMARMQRKLSDLLGGRIVGLRTPEDLPPTSGRLCWQKQRCSMRRDDVVRLRRILDADSYRH